MRRLLDIDILSPLSLSGGGTGFAVVEALTQGSATACRQITADCSRLRPLVKHLCAASFLWQGHISPKRKRVGRFFHSLARRASIQPPGNLPRTRGAECAGRQAARRSGGEFPRRVRRGVPKTWRILGLDCHFGRKSRDSGGGFLRSGGGPSTSEHPSPRGSWAASFAPPGDFAPSGAKPLCLHTFLSDNILQPYLLRSPAWHFG